MTCAAVCLIGNTLYITTNDIYAVSTKSNKPIDNQGIKFLKMATKHFLSKSFHESEVFTDDDINILLTNYKGKFNSQYKGQPGAPNLQEDEIKRIISHLLNASPIKKFMDIYEITLGFFEQFLNKSDKESIPRPSHVFEKIIEVQRTFLGLWRDVRDY